MSYAMSVREMTTKELAKESSNLRRRAKNERLNLWEEERLRKVQRELDTRKG